MHVYNIYVYVYYNAHCQFYYIHSDGIISLFSTSLLSLRLSNKDNSTNLVMFTNYVSENYVPVNFNNYYNNNNKCSFFNST